MTHAGRISGFELGLPEGWTVLPPGADRTGSWAADLARELVAEAPLPDDGDGGSAGEGGLPEDEAPLEAGRAVELLAGQLEDVAAAAADVDDPGLHVAVLVRQPRSAVVEAMLTVGSQPGTSPQEYVDEIAAAVEESPGDYLVAEEIAAEVPAGDARGAHLMLGHLEPDEDGEVAHLEERVALGVFPPGSLDMVELVVVASGVATFTDMPTAVLRMAAGIEIHVGEPA